MDLFGLSLTHKLTTIPFYNQSINSIAQYLMTRYGDKAVSLFGFNFAPLGQAVPEVDFPDMTIIDCLADLYDIPIYNTWINYSGQLETFPKLGTAASGSGNQLGYPDCTVAPTPFFTFPDSAMLIEIEQAWQRKNFTNSVKVLGQALATQTQLGPSQILATLYSTSLGGFLAPGASVNPVIEFTSQTGNNNKLSATNVYIEIYDPSFVNDTPTGQPYKYIATVPGLYSNRFPSQTIDSYMSQCKNYVTNPSGGYKIPAYDTTGFPVSQVGNSDFPYGFQKVISEKSSWSGREEGVIALISPNAYSVSPPASMTSVALNLDANSDGGGFIYAINVWGQPYVYANNILTGIADYNPIAITETLQDLFGDHQTYQGSKIPWCLGTLIEVKVNPSAMPTTTATSAIAIGAFEVNVASSTGFLITPGATPGADTVNLVAIDTTNATANSTTLSGTIAAGALSLVVASATGYAVGNPITIDPAGSTDYNTIASISGTAIGLAAPTSYAHTSGCTIYAPTTREYAAVATTGTGTITFGTPLQYAHASGVTLYGLSAVLSGDSVYQSLYMHADWEAGQLLFDSQVFDPFSADAYYTSTPTSSAITTSDTFLTQFILNPAPEVVYQSRREVNNPDTSTNNALLTYTFTGLTPGIGYKLRLHFADPVATEGTGTGSRAFVVIVNGACVNNNLNIYEATANSSSGSYSPYAYVYEVDGATATAAGDISIQFANGPAYKLLIGDNCGYGSPCISGIEIVPPEGDSVTPFAINCGGSAIGPSPATTLSAGASAGATSISVVSSTGMVVGNEIQVGDNSATTTRENITIGSITGTGPYTVTLAAGALLGYNHASGANVYVLPVVQVAYAYSNNQQTFGLQSKEINDPLISTYQQAITRAQYEVNRSAWSVNTGSFAAADVPTIKPGVCVKFWNSRLSLYFYVYVKGIKRTISRDKGNEAYYMVVDYLLLYVSAT